MNRHRILVTGGAGYIGSVLCPRLVQEGHEVCVYDGFFFGRKPVSDLLQKPGFSLEEGDIRDRGRLEQVFRAHAFDRVIHLAAVSNDPSSELDADITRSVNLEGTRNVMELARQAGVARFLYASSASVYGLREESRVTEDLELQPLTLYARYKGEGEEILSGLVGRDFEGVSVRSATVCGMSPRLRLDLTVNILTHQAICRRKISVFGGDQVRPNVHVRDLVDFYTLLLDAPGVSGEAFNVSESNATVREIAEIVRDEIDGNIPIEVTPTNDNRSYRLDASKVTRQLGWKPGRGIVDAVRDLAAAFADGRVPEPESSRYRNVALMSEKLDFWRRFA
ncbi:MAG: SDR family oxidoreductase [Deltaproteobacteria bacterium]|nr:SDR family oxidoreductase [Deltaproteobacteria bacterium]